MKSKIGSRDWWFAFALTIIISAALSLSIKSGVSMTDALTGFHLHPKLFVSEIWHSWTDKVYLGTDTGAMQIALFPGAVIYALLEIMGIGSGISQRIVFFLIFLASGISICWFLAVAAKYVTKTQPLIAIAPCLYIGNLYVAYTMVGNSPTLWPYAVLPAILALTILALKTNRPLRIGAYVALLSVPMAGSNPTLIIINVIVIATFLAYLVMSAEDKRRALQDATRFTLVAFFGALLCNAYWLVPFISYARGAWLPGVFSESVSWHSSLANAPDIMRLLGGEGFFSSDPSYGFFYPYQQFFRDHGIVEAASRLLPVLALSTILWRVCRVESLLRYFAVLAIAMVFLASGTHQGSDGGAWTSEIYRFLSEHFPFFQIFRELEKWDSIIALAFAILLAYNGDAFYRKLIGFPAFIRCAPGAAIILLAVTTISPILYFGPFRGESMISSLPTYWDDAAKSLADTSGRRAALYPKQYLPHFFWGEVLPDFPGIALQHAAVSSVAASSGAPTEGSAFAIEALYRGLSEGAPWVDSLLSRLSIDNVIDQRDAYYPLGDVNDVPLAHGIELRSVRNLAPQVTIGDLASYNIRSPLPILSLARPFITALNGADQLSLLSMLRPDEIATSATGNEGNLTDIPGIVDSDDFADLAAELTPAIVTFHVSQKPSIFHNSRDRNVVVFARTSEFVPWGAHAKVLIDGSSGTAVDVSDTWVAAAKFRAFKGDHVMSESSPAPPIDVQLKIIDADAYEQTYSKLNSSPHIGRLLEASASGNGTPLTITSDSMYSVRARVWPHKRSSVSIPLNFTNGATAARTGSSCTILPVIPDISAIEEQRSPPRGWFYDRNLTPLTMDGRVRTQWFANQAKLQIYNPFRKVTNLTIRGTFAALGMNRVLSLVGPDGVSRRDVTTLYVPTYDRLDALKPDALKAPAYSSLIGDARSATFNVLATPGWSTFELHTTGYDALPNSSLPFSGFVSFGVLGSIEAEACGVTQPHVSRESVSDKLIVESSPERPEGSGATLTVPNIPFDFLPRLSLMATSQTNSRRFAIVHFRNKLRQNGTFSVQFTQVSSSSIEALLVPRDHEVTSDSMIVSVDIIAPEISGTDILSEPTLHLSRVPLESSHPLDVRGNLSESRNVYISFDAKSALESTATSVVIDFTATDPAHSSISLNAPRGLFFGRSVLLENPTIVLNGDVNASVTFTNPTYLPGQARDEWRRLARLFLSGHELQQSAPGPLLPFHFSIGPNSIQVAVPATALVGTPVWRMVYLPDPWLATSENRSETFEYRIPVANALTTLDGRLMSLQNSILMSTLYAPDASQDSRNGMHVDNAHIESFIGSHGEHIQKVMIDNKPLELKPTGYGWAEGMLRLPQGKHIFRSLNDQPLRALLLPDAEAHGIPRHAQIDANVLDTSNWQADFNVSQMKLPVALVLREAFNSSWHVELNGSTATHVLADTYANAFILNPKLGKTRLSLASGGLLFWSRITTAIAIICSLILILTISISHRVRGRNDAQVF